MSIITTSDISKLDSRKANVVVVGAGPAGAVCAHDISAKLDTSKYNLILVSERPYFLHLVACIRMTVSEEDHVEKKALIPLDKNFVDGKGALLVGSVASIREEPSGNGQLVFKDGAELNYTTLVLATGSIWEGPLNFPNTAEETDAWIASWRKKFADANDIVIVGGGACSIEFAGEVRDLSKTKNVTIVTGQSALLNNTYPQKWRHDVGKRVKELNINLITGEYIDNVELPSNHQIQTRSGKSLKADLIIPSRGNRPNTKFIGESLGADVLNKFGYVKVKTTLQLPEHPAIFAGGDIIDWNEQKQAGKYYTHASVLAANVLEYLEKKTASTSYKGSPELIVITLGRAKGACYFGVAWGLMFGNFLAKTVKSATLLLGPTRAKLGVKD